MGRGCGVQALSNLQAHSPHQNSSVAILLDQKLFLQGATRLGLVTRDSYLGCSPVLIPPAGRQSLSS